MTISRRDLLKLGASTGILAVFPRPLLAQFGARPEPVPPIEDPRLKALALRAIEAARNAGASYADVRLTHTRTRIVPYPNIQNIQDGEQMVVGMRALVNGYWGFASGPVWSPDEMARLGREAVHQAKTNSLGKSRVVELAPAPVVTDGHWVMPVKFDPFETSPFEIVDHLQSLGIFAARTPGARVGRNDCTFVVQEKAFASTPGSYCTQRLYTSQGTLRLELKKGEQKHELGLDLLTPAGLGWELYTDQPLREAIRQKIAEIQEDMALPVKPVEVGRYDTVFDARSMSSLLDETLGRATELDRALGYEANAGGTSYLNDPFAMVGSYQAGSPLLTMTANRSTPGGAATVQWDDEGIAPDEFTVVKDGVLTDFQTTRESAGWLADYYVKQGTPVRSHGCANAPSALEVPLQHAPNLVLVPGREALDFDAAVAGIANGIAVKEVGLDMDFQSSSGLGTGRAYEIKQGKRVARLSSAGLLFRAPELWKGLRALGGPQSVRRFGMQASKGEPAQKTHHSVTAPPAVYEQLTFVDVSRKA